MRHCSGKNFNKRLKAMEKRPGPVCQKGQIHFRDDFWTYRTFERLRGANWGNALFLTKWYKFGLLSHNKFLFCALGGWRERNVKISRRAPKHSLTKFNKCRGFFNQAKIWKRCTLAPSGPSTPIYWNCRLRKAAQALWRGRSRNAWTSVTSGLPAVRNWQPQRAGTPT